MRMRVHGRVAWRDDAAEVLMSETRRRRHRVERARVVHPCAGKNKGEIQIQIARTCVLPSANGDDGRHAQGADADEDVRAAIRTRRARRAMEQTRRYMLEPGGGIVFMLCTTK